MTLHKTIQIKRVNPDAELPSYAHDGDAALDLRSMEDVTLAPGGTKIVGTGIAVAIPTGLVGLVFPRSGLGSKGLTLSNAVGVIDSGYRGEIRAPLHNNHPHSEREPNGGWMTVHKGDRVCQIAFMPYAIAKIVETDSLDETNRGENGFGSTGNR